jgi:hypothetical protein
MAGKEGKKGVARAGISMPAGLMNNYDNISISYYFDLNLAYISR